MAEKIIKYFNENIYSPYHVLNVGIVKGGDKIFKNLSSSLQKNLTSVDNSVQIEYKGFNGTLVATKKEKKTFRGDLKADGKNSFYLGRHVVRNGDRAQRSYKAPSPMHEFYQLHKESFKRFDVDVENAVIVRGCFKTNKTTIQRTMIPETKSIFAQRPNMDLIKKKEFAIKTMIRKLQIPQLPKCEIDDLYLNKFNLKTYPGFTYAEYLNFKTKEEALDVAMYVAKQRWKNIEKFSNTSKSIKRNYLYPNTFSVGARNKREIIYENGEELNSRPVHMPEFHGEICDAIWTDQISDYIKQKGKGPIYIGNNITKFERLFNDFHQCKNIFEGDIKRFDSSLFNIDIIIAVCISRLYYDIHDSSIDNHFIAIYDTVGIKDYITPGGYVYRLIHGLPSGVKSTSLYGSFINFNNLIHCTRSKSQRKMRYSIGSDDFLIGSLIKTKKQFVDKIKYEGKKIGYKFKFLRTKDFFAENFDDRPIFYKYTIDNGEPVIPTSVILERAFIPWSKVYRSNSEVLKFLHDLVPSLGAPRSNSILFYIFYCYIFRLVTKREKSILSLYKYHLFMYKKVMSGNYPLKRTEDSFPTLLINKVDTNYTPKFKIHSYFRINYSTRCTLRIRRRSL